MILFTNPGELDIRAATTLGINVKEGDSPIGFFGTGLKYAIAALLRTGHSIEIFSGNNQYSFEKVPQLIRGKSFDFVHLTEKTDSTINTRELGFTTELGKTWELWQVYRELYSNTEDEHGEIHKISDFADARPFVGPGQTSILVSGDEFDKVHSHRKEFILDKDLSPIYENKKIQVFSGLGQYAFYRGIRAYKLAKPSRFIYNFIDLQPLTEDRTLRDWSLCEMALGNLMVEANDKELCTAMLSAGESYIEGSLWVSSFTNPSEEFFEVAGQLIATNPLGMNQRAAHVYNEKRRGDNKEHRFIPFNVEQEAQLSAAKAFCTKLGYPMDKFPIRLAESLGNNIAALAYRNEILLCPETFTMGVLLEALIEEYVHLAHGHQDTSRSMQNFLFAEIVRIGKGQ